MLPPAMDVLDPSTTCFRSKQADAFLQEENTARCFFLMSKTKKSQRG